MCTPVGVTNEFEIGPYLLVATGYKLGVSDQSDVQIVNLGTGNICSSYPSYPSTLWSGAGGFINNTLTICGGSCSTCSPSVQKSCYKFNTVDNQWDFLFDMETGRSSLASATLPDGSMWITGILVIDNVLKV